MITQPLLAAKKPVFEKLKFPVLATPKIDGIRCVKVNGQALSRSFKPIPNHHIRGLIEKYLPDGVDGEIICGSGFSDVQSMVMSREGTPVFTYLIFDYVKESLEKEYHNRLNDAVTDIPVPVVGAENDFIKILFPRLINNLDELYAVMQEHLQEGHEGTMIRTPESPYKCGRSSLKEGYLIAIKYFEDGEAEVIGFEEQMHNDNEKELDAFGHSERSSKKENMIPANTLGALIVNDPKFGEFSIGTGQGLTAELRKKIWDNQSEYLGKLAHYRYQPHGVKDKPRIPVWHGFRSKEDMSNG